MSSAVIFIARSLLIIDDSIRLQSIRKMIRNQVRSMVSGNSQIQNVELNLLYQSDQYLLQQMRALSYRLFGSNTKKEHILTLSRQLLNNYRTFRPWKNIRLIHELTMSSYDPEIGNIEKTTTCREDQEKIHAIINQLSGQLHQVPHQEVNLLLNVLKQRGYRYSGQLPIFRGLNKVVKMLLGNQLKAQLLPKTLFYMKALQFPKLTTIKMFQEFLFILDQEGVKEQAHIISLANLVKLAIISVEEPYIPFPIVKKMLESVLKESANTLSSRCALYHLRVILPNALKAKVEYQATRANTRSILFNPYSSSEEERDPKESTQDQSQGQNQYRSQVRHQLQEMASEIGKLFEDSLDIKKLQLMIIEGVKADIQPFTKESIIYVSDILQLRPKIQQYLSKNLEDLTPVQLIYLAKRCKDMASDQIKIYLDKLGPFMSLEETAYLLCQANRHFHYPVRAQMIISLVNNLPSIDYRSFLAIAKLTERISKDEQEKIKQILRVIQDKMSVQGTESSDKERV